MTNYSVPHFGARYAPLPRANTDDHPAPRLTVPTKRSTKSLLSFAAFSRSELEVWRSEIRISLGWPLPRSLGAEKILTRLGRRFVRWERALNAQLLERHVLRRSERRVEKKLSSTSPFRKVVVNSGVVGAPILRVCHRAGTPG